MGADCERRSRSWGRSAVGRRSARPRRSHGSDRCSGSLLRAAVELRPEESRGALEDLVGAAQLPVLLLELDDTASLLGGEARSSALVDLGLADPLAKRLRSDAEV